MTAPTPEQHTAESGATCVYEDADRERPLLTLPGHYGCAFGHGIPPKRWCWTHCCWDEDTTVTSPEVP